MERYHDFQIKDHYFWTGATPDLVTKEERQAAKAKAQPTAKPEAAPTRTDRPRYKNWTVHEPDGNLTYY